MYIGTLATVTLVTGELLLKISSYTYKGVPSITPVYTSKPATGMPVTGILFIKASRVLAITLLGHRSCRGSVRVRYTVGSHSTATGGSPGLGNRR